MRQSKARAIRAAMNDLSRRGLDPALASPVRNELKRRAKGVPTDAIGGMASDIADELARRRARAIIHRTQSNRESATA